MSNTVTLSFKPQWEGIVKIDDSFDDYASNISEYGNYKQITIEDVKYHNLAYATFDHVSGIQNFPNIVTIVVFGNELQGFMKCKAVLGYQEIAKTKGLIRKKTFYEDVLRTKGFNL